MSYKLCLASGSPQRLDVLRKVLLEPDIVLSTNVDESYVKGASAKNISNRLAKAKADEAIKLLFTSDMTSNSDKLCIITVDTLVACGNRILGKPKDAREAIKYLNLLSGRSHRVYSGFCVSFVENGRLIRRVSKNVMTRIVFKRLHVSEIDFYLATNQWQDKAGAYGIQGVASQFVKSITGSFYNVVGMPIFEIINVLKSCGLYEQKTVKNDYES